MKTLLGLFAVAVAMTAQPGFAAGGKATQWKKEPAGALGLQFGKAVTEQEGLTECPRSKGSYSGDARDESFTGFCYEKPAGAEMYTSWRTYNQPSLGAFTYTLHIMVLEGVVHGVEISVPRAQSDNFLEALVERYGLPAGVSKEVLKNSFGAAVTNRTFRWEGRKVAMSYDDFGEGMSRSLTVMVTKEFMEAVDEQRARQRKEAGSKL